MRLIHPGFLKRMNSRIKTSKAKELFFNKFKNKKIIEAGKISRKRPKSNQKQVRMILT